jgi:hypothetical protein
MPLKGQCHEIFDLRFFSFKHPSWIFALENLSYLGDIEAEFKKALARESGA